MSNTPRPNSRNSVPAVTVSDFDSEMAFAAFGDGRLFVQVRNKTTPKINLDLDRESIDLLRRFIATYFPEEPEA